tara:strand:+ start:297 stop:761 length:465 start_codon:yes stop_codon:yes gene_type:complete
MRLFIPSIEINNLKIKNIENYKNLSKKKYIIITNQNLLLIKRNNIYNLKQIDEEIIKSKFNNYEFLIDKSYFKQEKLTNHIPYNHYILEFLIEEYILNSLDEIKLCIEYIKKNNTFIIYDFYFKIDNNLIDPTDLNKFNKSIIDTFLFYLTNIN